MTSTPARENSIPPDYTDMPVEGRCPRREAFQRRLRFPRIFARRDAPDTEGREGLEKKEGCERSLRGESGRECKKPGKPKPAALARDSEL